MSDHRGTGTVQVSRSFTESLLVSVVLIELAVLLGIGFADYGEASAGGVIVLVAVRIDTLTVVVGKVQPRTGDEATDVGRISTDDLKSFSD